MGGMAQDRGGRRVQLLLTGSELMSGDTVDSNSAAIAQRLAELGLPVWRKVTVGDELPLLVHELRALAAGAEVLIVNGGLGPTVDDLTAEALAIAAGVPLAEHPEALAHLHTWCERRGLPLNAANRKQALLPAGCSILPNPRGSAVGIALRLGTCRVYCTPGVPSEMRAMLDVILEDLRAAFADQLGQRHILRLQTFGLGESTAQQMISDAFPDWPAQVELGFRAGAPQMEIKLAVDGGEHLRLRDAWQQRLLSLIGDHVIGEGDSTLAARVGELLRERGERVCTAESCTGGQIAAMLTAVSGISSVFEAGYVSYSNRIKEQLLGVRADTLAGHGAVSEATVREMALGALAHSGADHAIAVSGIAGPDGGTADKPVGTVCLARGSRNQMNTLRLHWPAPRALFQTMVAATALDLLRRQLLGITPHSHYVQQRISSEATP